MAGDGRNGDDMSKQSEAKEKQGYVEKFIPTVCSNCAHCQPVMGERLGYIDPNSWTKGTHMAQTQVSQKCGIGGFAVKKMGSCAEHVFSEDADKTANVEFSGQAAASSPRSSAGTQGYASEDEK
jgi:hypothetical protein